MWTFLLGIIFTPCVLSGPPPPGENLRFSPLDQAGLARIGKPVPSPFGKYAVVPVYSYNVTTGEHLQSLHLLNLRSNKLTAFSQPVPGVEQDYPVWADEQTVLWVAKYTANQSNSELWIQNITSAVHRKLAHFPISVSNPRYNVKMGWLTFTAEVYKSANLDETFERDQLERRHDTAKLYDQLFIRHWDEWLGPKRHNIFLAPLSLDEFPPRVNATPVNLLTNTDLECPVRPHGDFNDYELSPDGKLLAFSAKKPGVDFAWSTHQNIYLLNLTATSSALAKPVSLTEGNLAVCSRPVFSKNGQYLAWLQMRKPQYELDRRQIVVYHLATKTKYYLAEDWDRSPTEIVWSACSNFLYVIAEEFGQAKIFKIPFSPDSVTKADKVKLVVKKHTSSGVRWSGTDTLIFLQSALNQPPEVYTVDLLTQELTRRTFVTKSFVERFRLSEPSEVWFKGANDQSVMAWYLPPSSLTKSSRPKSSTPLAVVIHGGPQSAWNDDWSWKWNFQILSGADFAVLAVNYHGSTGYGQAFSDSIRNEWGSVTYTDIMAGVDHILKKHSYLDPERLVALGGSFGGYMTNWLNGHTDRFVALVNHAGMFSTKSFYYSTEELYFPEYDLKGTPWTVPENYDKWNGELFVKHWKTPTLVIHGALDYRVPETEGISTFTALQRLNVPSRLLYFPDEDHWILKPGNSLRWNVEVLRWLNHWCSLDQMEERRVKLTMQEKKRDSQLD